MADQTDQPEPTPDEPEEAVEDLELDEDEEGLTERVRGGRQRAISIP